LLRAARTEARRVAAHSESGERLTATLEPVVDPSQRTVSERTPEAHMMPVTTALDAGALVPSGAEGGKVFCGRCYGAGA
jgi:hypothetical protein